MSTKCRVKGTILKNVLCGHSCNYIYSICNELDNKFLLGVLNSKVVNYYFKYFNQTNNVPIGEIKGIPFPSSRKEDRLKIIELVDEIYNARISSKDYNIEQIEEKINQIVYHMYGLTDAEIKIIEQSI